MIDEVECQHCYESYPVVACRGRCPSCGVKDGADGVRHGRVDQSRSVRVRADFDE